MESLKVNGLMPLVNINICSKFLYIFDTLTIIILHTDKMNETVSNILKIVFYSAFQSYRISFLSYLPLKTGPPIVPLLLAGSSLNTSCIKERDIFSLRFYEVMPQVQGNIKSIIMCLNCTGETHKLPSPVKFNGKLKLWSNLNMQCCCFKAKMSLGWLYLQLTMYLYLGRMIDFRNDSESGASQHL